MAIERRLLRPLSPVPLKWFVFPSSQLGVSSNNHFISKMKLLVKLGAKPGKVVQTPNGEYLPIDFCLLCLFYFIFIFIFNLFLYIFPFRILFAFVRLMFGI